MNIHEINPYIRTAMYSRLTAPFVIETRVIFDYELIYVRGGGCEITYNGVKKQYSEGQILLLCPGVPHRFEGIPGVNFDQPHIHFDLQYDRFSLERYISFKNLDALSPRERGMIAENVLGDDHLPETTVRDREQFQTLFFRIIDLYHYHKPRRELLGKALLCELLELLPAFDDLLASPEPNHSREEQIRNYIEANYKNGITLDGLSRHFYVNKYTLTRRFRECYGVSPIHFVNQMKLQEAARRLADDDLSVGDIGAELGFSSIYAFSRFFKNGVGMSPDAYRQINRQ